MSVRAGFDAFMGNPPWISYAGRAAQPLEDPKRDLYSATYEAFAGYRNLQGLFIERSASLLGPSGRLGLVVPSSMSEQEGYGPTRMAHERRCECELALTDLGAEAFVGVFQPCMVLISTRRAKPIDVAEPSPWPVERTDLDMEAAALLAKLIREPLPAHLFGERGLQTSGEDVAEMSEHATQTHCFPLRVGGDIEAFRLGPPSLFCVPSLLGKRLRTPAAWSSVRVLVRQTARFPIAVMSDGLAFRNSLLAGFEDDAHPAAFLAAYLNSNVVRWLHYMRHRDARQGMPQMKIGHLRSIPAPPKRELIAELARVGEALTSANGGLDADGQARIDDIVAAMFELTSDERVLVRTWRETLA